MKAETAHKKLGKIPGLVTPKAFRFDGEMHDVAHYTLTADEDGNVTGLFVEPEAGDDVRQKAMEALGL